VSPDSNTRRRKHFTSDRSSALRDVDLSRSGGEGLQLTKKRTEQKDSASRVSPMAATSITATTRRRRIYQYNKDPNTQIYVISARPPERRDRAVRYRTWRFCPTDTIA